MNYPLISEYIESIRYAEDNFATLTNLRPVLDNEGNPIMSSGNFAVVYKMKDKITGKLHAVKCFLREQKGREEAYRMISEELEYVSSAYLTPIKYLKGELFVNTSTSTETEFPVLTMDWVEGVTLEKYIRNHLNDKYELSMLAYQFSRLAMWLMPQSFAHGDLKPDNILVRDDGTLVLVDYDGMYVPAMKGQKARELGSPDFRHPRRTEKDFDEHIDDFSLAVILLSLKAISLQPSLLEEYGATDRLLFSVKDYGKMSESVVMSAMKSLMQDTEFAMLQTLFMNLVVQKNLSQESLRVFNLSKPDKSKYQEKFLSTKVSDEDIQNAWIDKFGVKYSADKKRLLKAPDKIEKYSVLPGCKIVCEYAFYDCRNLTYVQIPDNVLNIGNYAFCNCLRLTRIQIPSSLTSIGKCAFHNCFKLTHIDIPNYVASIGERAFWRCFSLTHIQIPNSLTSIENGVFCECEGFTYIQIPDSVTSIGIRAFWGCRKLTHIYISNSVTSIGKEAFSKCTDLTHIQIPNNITSIEEGVFCDCEKLTHIQIPNSVTSIENDAFDNCESLSSIQIPNSVTSIGDGVFHDCISLSHVQIPNSVISIGNRAFLGCQNLAHIQIPNSVKSIGHRAFRCCESLISIQLPNTLTSIGNGLFECSYELIYIIIPYGTRNKFKRMLPSDLHDKLIEQ